MCASERVLGLVALATPTRPRPEREIGLNVRITDTRMSRICRVVLFSTIWRR